MNLLAFVIAGFFFLEVNSQVVNPWVDTSSCLPTDTPVMCSLKKKQCTPVNDILKPSSPGGLMGALTACANSSGVVIGVQFYLSVGMSYAQSKPEDLMDGLTPDPKLSSDIRLCVLNSSGLIGSDLKFNRTAAIIAASKLPLVPNVVPSVFNALLSCPEPADYAVGPFLSCIREACMANATATYPTWPAGGAASTATKAGAGSPAAKPWAGSPAASWGAASPAASWGAASPAASWGAASPWAAAAKPKTTGKLSPAAAKGGSSVSPGSAVSPEVLKYLSSVLPAGA